MQNCRTLFVVAGVAAVCASSLAYGYSDAMRAQEQNNISFLTGGIGDEERDALNVARRNYNLHVMNSDKDGSFVGDTQVAIYDRTGNELVNASAGPLFYAELPAGKYIVMSGNEGMQQKKSITVSPKGSSDIHFIW